MADTTITVPDDFYVSPSDASRFLDVPVKELSSFQASGDLIDVLFTYGNRRKFNLAELAQLRLRRMHAAGDND